MSGERLMTLEEVAFRLGISYMKARMMVLRDGVIPYQKVSARGIRVKESDLNAYIEKLEVKEEKQSGSEGDKSKEPDRPREPYTGRGVLQADKRRDSPPASE